jgi:hypothetical protein
MLRCHWYKIEYFKEIAKRDGMNYNGKKERKKYKNTRDIIKNIY